MRKFLLTTLFFSLSIPVFGETIKIENKKAYNIENIANRDFIKQRIEKEKIAKKSIDEYQLEEDKDSLFMLLNLKIGTKD